MTIFLSLIRYASCGETADFELRAIMKTRQSAAALESIRTSSWL